MKTLIRTLLLAGPIASGASGLRAQDSSDVPPQIPPVPKRPQIQKALPNPAATNPIPQRTVINPTNMVAPAADLSPTNPIVSPILPRVPTNVPPKAVAIPAPAAVGVPAPVQPAFGQRPPAFQPAGPGQPPSGSPPPVGPGTPQGGSLANAIFPGSTNLSGLSPDAPLPKGALTRLQATPLEQVLAIYSELTGRIVLRPNTLPATAITLDTTAVELTRAEAIQALDSVLTLNGITMIPVGDKFVTAVPSTQAAQEAAVFSKVDPKNLPEAGQYVTKIVQLKNAKPSVVMPLIQGFAKTQNGILAIDDTQTLILRDYAANVKRMMEIIEKIDVQVEMDYKLEVIPIKYGKVEDIYSTMSSLVGGGGGGGGGTGAAASGLPRPRTGPSRSSSASRTGSRTGSSTMGGRGTGMATQQAQPGVTPGAGGTFQDRLRQIVNRAATGGDVQLLADARIVPDERSNSLIVFASKEDLVMITNIVSKVDRLLAQVLIEAIIMDVKITDSEELGVSMLMNQQKNGRLTSVAGSNNGQSFLSGVTNLSSGGLPGGFSYFGRWGGDLDVAVKALASNGRGNVMQTPRVQTSHAIPASFFTGETVPYVSASYAGGAYGGSSTSFQQMEVGIGLNVTPYITPDGLVVMDIQQTIEEISGYTEIANVGKVPNTSRREASATVSVQDKDTIILGGYIRTAKNNSKSGVPVLKDIPLLGALFRTKSEDHSRSELIVLLRPTVLPTPHDAAIMAGAEQDRLPGIRQMEKEMEASEKALHDAADKATGTKRRMMSEESLVKPPAQKSQEPAAQKPQEDDFQE